MNCNIQSSHVEISSLWVGKELSPIERLTIQSFLKNGHRFVLFTYGEVLNIPTGTTIRDANLIIPEQEIFLSHGSYAHFADWFRWRLLRLFGGLWVDMDVVCLKPFCFNREIIFGYEAGRLPNVSVLKFPAGHPVCVEMEDRCVSPNTFRQEDKLRDKLRKIKRRYLQKNLRSSTKWGEAGGPSGFKIVLEKHNLLNQGVPFTYFYPIHWSNAPSIFDSSLGNDVSMFSDTYGVHIWNEILRKNNINKLGPFQKDSLIAALIKKFEL